MFSQANPLDKLLENATSPNLLEIDWGLNMEICDLITNDKVTPKYALNAIKKKISSTDPHVSLYALQLLDACVSNCGLAFHLEVCSREFENQIIQILAKGHPIVIEKMKEFLKRWSEQEFKDNPQLSLIPALYNKLKKNGVKFKSSEPVKRKITELPSDPNVVTSNQEEEDIAKAIELSLKESASPKNYANKSSSSSLYPTINGNHSAASASFNNSSQQSAKEPQKVRALYDFEAAEDNEITFKAGEILMVLDDSDSNWWKGSNHRGEGLFPANFVTKNLEQEIEITKPPAEKQKSVQFNEEVHVKLLNEVVTEIDETKIDRLLYLLHEADPTGERPDSDELVQLEEQCLKMGPLIDQELEVVDKTHASLSSVNSQMVEALNLYCALMKENAAYTPNAMPQSPYMQQPPPAHQTTGAQTNPQYNYFQPYSYASMPNSMTPTSVPYNHIYSSPAINQTQTTYTVPPQVHYGELNSQQNQMPQSTDPSLQQVSSMNGPQQIPNQIPTQMMNNQVNYAPTSVLPNQ